MTMKYITNNGFEEFLGNKLRLIKLFELAKIQTKHRAIKTSYGESAEAEIREWFSDFLPKKYGVTSGFIISPKNITNTNPHYDLIIYDKINSPVLWEEKNPDKSKFGNSKAIPVEFVHGIFEIKSRLSTTTSKQAIQHLSLINNFLLPEGVDRPMKDSPYLPENFCCGCIFYELNEDDAYSPAILNNLLPIDKSFFFANYINSIILKGEGINERLTGRVYNFIYEEDYTTENTTIGRNKSSLLDISKDFLKSKNFKIGKDEVFGGLGWNENAFAKYMWDILALVSGKYIEGVQSSSYCVQTSNFKNEIK